MLVQFVASFPAKKRIPWSAIAKKMKTKKLPEQLRSHIRCLKRRFGDNIATFPSWYFGQGRETKAVEENAVPSLLLLSANDNQLSFAAPTRELQCGTQTQAAVKLRSVGQDVQFHEKPLITEEAL